MMKKKLIYTGSRTRNNKKAFIYFDFENPEDQLQFSKRKIARVESIGNIIECDVQGNSYSNCKITGKIQSGHKCFKLLLQWSVEERCSIEELNIISEAKKDNTELEKIITNLELITYSLTRNQRTRLARYVFERLIR